jgi:hypothetical protein
VVNLDPHYTVLCESGYRRLQAEDLLTSIFGTEGTLELTLPLEAETDFEYFL